MLKLFEHNTLNVNDISGAQTAVEVKNLNLWFGSKHVLNDISMRIPKNKITNIFDKCSITRLLGINETIICVVPHLIKKFN